MDFMQANKGLEQVRNDNISIYVNLQWEGHQMIHT